jgi:hypothetical protein
MTDEVKSYYMNPEVVWLEAGFGSKGGVNGGPIAEDGFYILHHCGRPECCRPEGPFSTIAEAKAWSQENLAKS